MATQFRITRRGQALLAKARTCDPANKAVPLVPVRWREAVIEDLIAIGLDANGEAI